MIPSKRVMGQKNILNIKEAAEYLGCTYRVMRALLDSGEIQYRKIGRRYFIGCESLMKWINCQK